MTHFNFSRWREKKVRRASGEPDEGPGRDSRFLFYFRALALNGRIPRRLLPQAGEVDSGLQATPFTGVNTYDRWYETPSPRRQQPDRFLALKCGINNINNECNYFSC